MLLPLFLIKIPLGGVCGKRAPFLNLYLFLSVKFNSLFTTLNLYQNHSRRKDAGHADQIWPRQIYPKKLEIKRNFSRFFHGVKSEIIYIILVNFVILNLITKALEIGIYR